MQYIEAPNREPAKFKSVFLAGGITNCPDWQKQVGESLEDLTITVFNPRRKHYPDGPGAEREQILWEFERLRLANLVTFWFSRGSVNPITLFELGSALERPTPLVIGVDSDYPRKANVEIQVSLRKPDLRICYSLEELVRGIKTFLST